MKPKRTEPVYHTRESDAAELRIASRLQRAWGCRLEKTSAFGRADFIATRESRTVSVIEIKRRKMRWGQYPDFGLNVDKVDGCRLIARRLGVPFILVVECTDGLYFANLTSGDYHRSPATYKARHGEQFHGEVYHIPNSHFKAVHFEPTSASGSYVPTELEHPLAPPLPGQKKPVPSYLRAEAGPVPETVPEATDWFRRRPVGLDMSVREGQQHTTCAHPGCGEPVGHPSATPGVSGWVLCCADGHTFADGIGFVPPAPPKPKKQRRVPAATKGPHEDDHQEGFSRSPGAAGPLFLNH